MPQSQFMNFYLEPGPKKKSNLPTGLSSQKSLAFSSKREKTDVKTIVL